MDRREIRALIASRPASESLQEAAAAAAYEAALKAQQAGMPSSVKAQILMAYAEEWRAMSEESDAIQNAKD